MLLKKFFGLQLFAEGGDGGAAGEGAGAASGVTGNGGDPSEQIPSSIPKRAHKIYLEAMRENRSAAADTKEVNHPKDQSTGDPTATKEEGKQKKATFSELIENEEYKAEREDYMHKTFEKRFAKYKGLEEENAKAKGLLAQMAERYGVDPNSANFFADLEKAQGEDNSARRAKELSEKYDMDPDEAKRIADSEAKLAESERQKKAEEFARNELQKRAEQEKLISNLRASAEKTSQKFPEFNLEECMKDESFRKICAVCGGDTTAAYIATHHDQIQKQTALTAAQQASVQVANAVAANRSRPAENGLSSVAPSVAETDFGTMSLKDIRAFAEEQRRMARRR